jgi:hypothetical protein
LISVRYEEYVGVLDTTTGEVIFDDMKYRSIIDAINRFSSLEMEKKIIQNLFETSWP